MLYSLGYTPHRTNWKEVLGDTAEILIGTALFFLLGILILCL